MTINQNIFRARTDSDEKIRPTPEELEAFLARAGTEIGRESRNNGLASYRRLLKEVEGFEQLLPSGNVGPDIRRRILLGVLSHTQIVNSVLLSEVELYAYHLQRIESLDFKTPTAFIKSAEHEISRLNPKRIDDVMRMKRLQEMIGERKKILAMLKKQWLGLVPELRSIALYIRDNLIRIEKLCEASVVILAEAGIGRTKERQLIEDVNNHFKDLMKKALHQGKITRENIDKIRSSVELLTTELSSLINEDGDALSTLYETIRNHVKTSSQDIASLLADLEIKKSGTVMDSLSLFRRLEDMLVSLLSGCHVEIKPTGIEQDSPHDIILNAKRAEMLDYLLGQVKKERRAPADRRTGRDRRKAKDPNYRGPERRSGRDRRSLKSRRSDTDASP
jgi:hypothetical protein